MKNLKNPTRDQKERIKKAKLDPFGYFVKEDKDGILIIVDKSTNEMRKVQGKKSEPIE